MRRLLSLIAASSLIFTLLVPGAAAQSHPFTEHQNNLIDDAFAVINYQGQQSNLVNRFVDKLIPQLQETEQEQTELLQTLLFDNNVSIVLGNPTVPEPEQLFYLIVEADQTLLSNVVDGINDFEELETTEYEDTTIYSSYKRKDFAAAYYNGVILVSDSPERLKLIIDNINPNSELKSYYDQIPNNSWLSIILNYKADLPEELGQLTNTYDYQVISIEEEPTNHFQITSYNQGNQTTFSNADFDYNDFTFTPALHQAMPGQNSFIYIEMSEVYQFITKTLELTELDQELGSDYTEITNMIAPYEAVLNNRTALNIQFVPNQMIPYITVATEITSEDSSELTAANELTDYITTKLDEEFDTQTAETGQLVTYDISSEVSNSANDLKLVYGLINNEHYVISNNPNIETEFNGDTTLANNSQFTTAFNDVLPNGFDSELTTLAYVAPAELSNFITTLSESSTNPPPADIDADLNKVTDYLSGLSPWTAFTVAENSYTVTETSHLHLKLDSLVDLIVDTVGKEITETEPSYTDKFRFSDVDFDNYEQLWYGDDLVELSDRNIIEGSSGEFLPGNSITRAEFVTMLVRYYNLHSNCLASDRFVDVPTGAWYDNNLCTAYEHGLVSGDDNGQTVRPNDPITRAEATQILANFSGVLQNATAEHQFTDVSDNDWFNQAVGKAFNRNIVQGRDAQTFAPNAPLTRAEAAALINRVRKNEFHLFQEARNIADL